MTDAEQQVEESIALLSTERAVDSALLDKAAAGLVRWIRCHRHST
ncbi:hypothetical protein [Streptomyces triculaminicus]|nr:hypothetical protein [Streptomyces triculaminicus]